MTDNQYFIIENDSSDNNLKISKHSDNNVFVSVRNDDLDISTAIYLNIDESLPCGAMIYDYASSGEVFLGPPPKGSKYFLSENNRQSFNNFFNLSLSQNPNNNFIKKAQSASLNESIVTEFFTHPTLVIKYKTEKALSLMFSEFFSIQEISDTQILAPESNKLCSYLTVDSDVHENYTFKSDTYPFANMVKTIAVCSHPNNPTDKINYCNYFYMSLMHSSSLMQNCPIFSPVENILMHKDISIENSSVPVRIKVSQSKSISGDSAIEFYNETDNVLISSIQSSDNDLNIEEIFNDFVSCYESSNISDVEEESSPEINPNSYLKTLLKG